MRIIQMKEDIDKYKVVEGQHDAHDTTNEENMRKFVQDYLDGKVPIHYLTEDSLVLRLKAPDFCEIKREEQGKEFFKVLQDSTKCAIFLSKLIIPRDFCTYQAAKNYI